MQKIIKKKTVYEPIIKDVEYFISEDGKEFEKEKECKDYENYLLKDKIIKERLNKIKRIQLYEGDFSINEINYYKISNSEDLEWLIKNYYYHCDVDWSWYGTRDNSDIFYKYESIDGYKWYVNNNFRGWISLQVNDGGDHNDTISVEHSEELIAKIKKLSDIYKSILDD